MDPVTQSLVSWRRGLWPTLPGQGDLGHPKQLMVRLQLWLWSGQVWGCHSRSQGHYPPLSQGHHLPPSQGHHLPLSQGHPVLWTSCRGSNLSRSQAGVRLSGGNVPNVGWSWPIPKLIHTAPPQHEGDMRPLRAALRQRTDLSPCPE